VFCYCVHGCVLLSDFVFIEVCLGFLRFCVGQNLDGKGYN
jgi:hypothetical protein